MRGEEEEKATNGRDAIILNAPISQPLE
jgi:hypothetical protein